MKIKYIFFVSAFFYSFLSIAQKQKFTYIEPTYDIEWLDLKLEDKDISLSRFVEDKNKYIWISTTNSLICFDGNASIRYKNGNAAYPFLKDTLLLGFRRMEMDTKGIIYSALNKSNQVVKYDPYSRKEIYRFPKKEQLAHKIIFSQIDKKGELFLFYKDAKSNIETFFLIKDDVANPLFEFRLPDNKSDAINDVEYDGKNFFVTASNYIYKLSTKGELLKKINNSHAAVSKNYIFSYTDKERVFFMSRDFLKISTWDKKSQNIREVFSFPKQGIYSRFTQFAVFDNIIVCASSLNLYIIDVKAKTYQNLKDSYKDMLENAAENIPVDQPVDLDIYSDGSIFLTTKNKLYKIKRKQRVFETFKEPIKGLKTQPSMRELTEDTVSKTIYASYYYGIAKKGLKDKNFKIISIPKAGNLKIKSAFSLSYHKNKLLFNNVSLDLKTKKLSKLTQKSLSWNHTTQFRKGDSLWLYLWGSQMLELYNLKDDISKKILISKKAHPTRSLQMINAIIEGETVANLWLATKSSGLSQITKKGSFVKNFSNKFLKSNSNTGITDLYKRGNLIWYGSSNGLGELHVKTETIHKYEFDYVSKQGKITKRKVFFILPKNKKQCYLGTDYGLILFDFITKQFWTLHDQNPLSQYEFNRKARFKSSDGKYYVGTTFGLFSFLPEELEWFTPIKSGEIRFNKISIGNTNNKYRHFNENLNTKKEIKLAANDLNLEVSFSSVKKENDVLYSYRIQGIKNNWSVYKKEQQITFLSLPVGKFTLELRTLNAPDLIKSIDLIKPEYWYKLWYSQLFFILTFITIISLFMRYLFKQKLEKQKVLATLRDKISRDLHDDVGSILTAVAMQSEILSKKAPQSDTKVLIRIATLSREAMSRMRDTVWSIDSSKDNEISLVTKMKDYLLDVFDEKNDRTYKFNYKSDSKKYQKLKPDVRQHIYLIFKEAVTNSLKHSNGNEITINFKTSLLRLDLEIFDNGTSIENYTTSGLGLKNIKNRAESMNAKFKIEKDKPGFKINISVKL